MVDKPGVIFTIGKEFADKNINILLFTHSVPVEDRGVVFIVGDFSDATCSPSDLLEELRGNSFVVKADLADKAGSIYYSSRLFPLVMDVDRVIIFGPGNIEGLIYNLRKNLGDEMAFSFLYHSGFGVGEAAYKRYFMQFGYMSSDTDKIMKVFDALLLSYGWGRMVHYEVEEDVIKMDIVDLWECELNKKNREPVGSHYFRGILKGLFQSLYKRDAEVKETRCISKGDDVCRFEITFI